MLYVSHVGLSRFVDPEALASEYLAKVNDGFMCMLCEYDAPPFTTGTFSRGEPLTRHLCVTFFGRRCCVFLHTTPCSPLISFSLS